MQITNILRAAKELHGADYQAISTGSGLPKYRIQEIFRGRREPNQEDLRKLFETLGCPKLTSRSLDVESVMTMLTSSDKFRPQQCRPSVCVDTVAFVFNTTSHQIRSAVRGASRIPEVPKPYRESWVVAPGIRVMHGVNFDNVRTTKVEFEASNSLALRKAMPMLRFATKGSLAISRLDLALDYPVAFQDLAVIDMSKRKKAATFLGSGGHETEVFGRRSSYSQVAVYDRQHKLMQKGLRSEPMTRFEARWFRHNNIAAFDPFENIHVHWFRQYGETCIDDMLVRYARWFGLPLLRKALLADFSDKSRKARMRIVEEKIRGMYGQPLAISPSHAFRTIGVGAVRRFMNSVSGLMLNES